MHSLRFRMRVNCLFSLLVVSILAFGSDCSKILSQVRAPLGLLKFLNGTTYRVLSGSPETKAVREAIAELVPIRYFNSFELTGFAAEEGDTLIITLTGVGTKRLPNSPIFTTLSEIKGAQV